MSNKKQKLICFILAIFVFSLGMYFEDINTASYFPSPSMNETDSYIMSGDVAFVDTEVCTAEMLGVPCCKNIHQLARHYVTQKRDSRIAPVFWCSTASAQFWGKFSTDFEIIKFFGRYQEELVLNYIHKSDGKK